MGWPDLACYGSKFHETPNIDRLARQGMKFSDAYAACPVCSPTRASIMAGQYPARIGITDFIPGHWRPYEKLIVPENRLELLNEYLQEFERRDVRAEVPLQPSFAEPRRLTRSYAASGGPEAAKGMITVNWLLHRIHVFEATSEPGSEYLRFFAVQILSATVNLGVYFVAVVSSALMARWPILALAIGSALAMFVTYYCNSRFVFTQRGS